MVTGAMIFASNLQVPAWCQGHSFEGSRIVRDDERGEELQLGGGLTEQDEGEKRLPWIPLLSPTMICLDCWITKTLKIQDFYQQQAAQEYFAHSESCADLILCPDPHVGTAFKYSVLAPIYALRPHLLMKNCAACGAYPPGGSGAAAQMSGPPPPLMPAGGPPSSMDLPSPMPDIAPPQNSMGTSQAMPRSDAPAASPRLASSNKWANMSDQEILDHFGLNGGGAKPESSTLDAPLAAATGTWQYADEGPPAMTLVAQRDVPASGTPKSSAGNGIEAQSSFSDAELALPEAPKKKFSVTDDEYDRLKDVERDLLSLPTKNK